ncbi:MAG: serine/threonine-protein kinase [Planctomycetota bacterium]
MKPDQFTRLQTIFRQVVDLDSSVRAAAIEELCAGDDDLRTQLEALLEHTGVSRDDDPLLHFGSKVRQTLGNVEPERRLPLPERFGRYRIERLLGDGGMGSVYEATQDHPRRRVALKVLPAGIVSKSALRRFELEVEVLGRLSHPGIAQIYDAGFQGHDDSDRSGGRPYFAMEFVNGTPLDRSLAGQPLRRQLKVFQRVCEAVHYAHTQGVVHRDLKPANILVDERGRPKVLDFGVARVSDPELKSTTLVTREGQLVGTVHYMSPEQAAGDAAGIDTRSDVYSLGVILFEALSGELPLPVRGKRLHEALRIVQERDARRLGDVDPEMRGGDLETILAKALEHAKEARYQSVQALEMDLERFVRGEAIEARPLRKLQQFGRFARRNQVALLRTGIAACGLGLALFGAAWWFLATEGAPPLVGLSVGVVALVVGAWAGFRVLRELGQQRRLAAAATESARVEAERAAAIQDFVCTAFRSGIPSHTRGRAATVQQLVDAMAEQVGELRDNREAQGWALDLLGTSYLAFGELDQAEFQLRSAVRTRQQVLGRDHPLTLRSRHHLIAALNRVGKLEEAEELGRQNLQLRQQVVGSKDPDTLASRNVLAWSCHTLGQRGEAKQLLEGSLSDHRETLGQLHEATLATMSLLAIVLDDLGDADRALDLLEAARRGRRRVLGEAHPATLRSSSDLAGVLRGQGRLEEAMALLKNTSTVQRRVCGTEHPDTLTTMHNLALLHTATGQTMLAAQLLEQVLPARIRSLGRQNPATIKTMIALVNALRADGQRPEAQSLAQQALRACEQVLPGGVEVLLLNSQLGALAHEQADPQSAVRYFRAAMLLAARMLPTEAPERINIQANYALVLRESGSPAAASQLLAECYKVLGEGDVSLPRVQDGTVGQFDDLCDLWGRQESADLGISSEPPAL